MNQAAVVECSVLANGAPTWQAEILVPSPGGGVNSGGRLRTMYVRGPPRSAKDQAIRDAQLLDEAMPGGTESVRAVANQMQRAKKTSGV